MSDLAIRLDALVEQLPGKVWRGRAQIQPSFASGDRLSTGFRSLDEELGGGFPRGALSEVVARGSAGATSLAYRLCVEVTSRAELAVWIDASDTLDPASAAAAGIDLERLLWVRPPDWKAALTAAELVLSLGGFPLVLLDLGQPPAGRSRGGRRHRKAPVSERGPMEKQRGQNEKQRAAQSFSKRLPSNVWVRLSRAASESHGALVVFRHDLRPEGRHDLRPEGRHDLRPEGRHATAGHGHDRSRERRAGPSSAGESTGTSAGPWASVTLGLRPAAPQWMGPPEGPTLLEGLESRIEILRRRGIGGHQHLEIRVD